MESGNVTAIETSRRYIMTVDLETPECKIFKTYQGYVAQLHVPETEVKNDEHKNLPTPILIVDISGECKDVAFDANSLD